MNRYISLCWDEIVRCDGQIIQIQYRLSYVTIQGTKRKKVTYDSYGNYMYGNTVLTSRACSFLTLYFLQMFYYIYINTLIYSTVIGVKQKLSHWLSVWMQSILEKMKNQSRQVNNYKANAYKGGITQVHRWYQITWGSEEGRSLMPLGFC